jgi:hypothetical protein
MELGQLYQFILLLVMLGMLVGASLVVLVNFQTAAHAQSGLLGTNSSTAELAISNTTSAIASIPNTWLGIIVIISIMSVIIVLIIRAFGGAGQTTQR